MPLLSVQNLKKYYGSHKAVDDISFDIEKGSIFGLLGPNGAGKSTLLRMITGIFYPDSGAVLFDGEPLDIRKHVAEMGYMPEERGLYRKMKIGEQAVYLARLRGLSHLDAQKKCHEWFERLGMETWWNKNLEDLSKGMGQKLQFVVTVVHEPKLLILDEPFSGLDPVNADVLKDEIFRLAKDGTTIIFSTHRMEQVEEICDQIVLINKGHKLIDGQVQAVKNQFKENHFRVLLDAEAARHPEWGQVLKQDRSTYVLALEEGHSTNEILEYYMNQGLQVQGFEEILPSLHDIFIRLVQDAPISRPFA